MRLRMAASILTLLCSWVLWEKWTVIQTGKNNQPLVEAVSESKTLAECRAAMPGFAKQRADWFRSRFDGPDYQIIAGDSEVIFGDESHNRGEHYVYYCLPSTIDPYRHPD